MESFRRPINYIVTRYTDKFVGWFSSFQHPYSVRWIADADVDSEDYGEIGQARLLIVIGHSEYWTRRAGEHFGRFVLNGCNALILSGNTMWWQVRYSDDQSQLVCYKNAPDPVADPLLRTVNRNSKGFHCPILPSLRAEFPAAVMALGQSTRVGMVSEYCCRSRPSSEACESSVVMSCICGPWNTMVLRYSTIR